MNLTLVRLITALAAVIEMLEGVFDRTGQFLSDLWEAFPSPRAMTDVTVRYFTGLAGYVLGQGLTIHIGLAATLVGKRCRGKLMMPEQAINFVRYSFSETIQTVTMTNEQGLTEFAVQKISLWFWHLIKRFELIRAVIGIKELADVIAIFSKVFSYRVAVLTVAAVFALIALLVAIAGGVTGNLLLLFADDSVKFCLSQDSKFVRTRHKHKRRRENLRAGPDIKAFPAKSRTKTELRPVTRSKRNRDVSIGTNESTSSPESEFDSSVTGTGLPPILP